MKNERKIEYRSMFWQSLIKYESYIFNGNVNMI